MLASICRRRLLLHLPRIPPGGGKRSFLPSPSELLLSHGYSSSALAGEPCFKPCPTTVSYLVSCGLTPAAAAARKIRIRCTSRADAVLALLRGYGFSDADITKMLHSNPQLLLLNPDRILRPKLDLFASLGLRPSKVATTALLARSLKNHLIPCIEFLRGILGSDGEVGRAITHAPRTLMCDLERKMRPAVEALRRLGLPESALPKLLATDIGVLVISPDRLGEIFGDLKALGFAVTETGFLYGICALSTISKETFLRKLALYRSFGVPEGDLRKALRTQPNIIRFSDNTIKKKLRFFVDELKVEPSAVIRHPVLIAYSLERCIIPRCAVLSLLMREGKIGPDTKLISALLGAARAFSDRYVMRHADDVPDVVKAYEGKIPFQGFKKPVLL